MTGEEYKMNIISEYNYTLFHSTRRIDYIPENNFLFTLYITIYKCIRRNPLNESYIKPIKERGNLKAI